METPTNPVRFIDPNNPRRGKTSRVVRNDKAPVRSLHPAHEPIVSIEEFTSVQVIRAAKSVGGTKGQSKQERNRRGVAHYALRGMVYCGSCGRKMQASRYNAK